jgi:hypothetical protein
LQLVFFIHCALLIWVIVHSRKVLELLSIDK